jgi:hypothetical protein
MVSNIALSVSGEHGKEVELGLGSLPTSALDGLQSSASLSGRFNPEKKTDSNWRKGWVRGMEILEKRESLNFYPANVENRVSS